MKLLVGLGNPGKKYARTRHNIGFRIVDHLALILAPPPNRWHRDQTLNSAWITCTVDDHEVVIAKPTTFMNESGLAVKALVDNFNFAPNDIMIVHDDKDILLGEYKMQSNRGSAGHNGIKSIIAKLGTKDFHRFRVGIASKNNERMQDTMKFVLGRFGLLERGHVNAVIDKSARQIRGLI